MILQIPLLGSLGCAGQTYHSQVISGNFFGGMFHPGGNPPLNSFYKTSHQIVLQESLRNFRGVRILISREHFRKIFVVLVNGKIAESGESSWGLFCGAMSAVMYAFMVICNKKASKISGMENSTLQLTISFLMVAVIVGLRQGITLEIAAENWPWILFLGLANTGIGCYFYFSSIGALPVQTVAICGYLEPLSAVLFSVLLLNESMTLLQILGAVLIIGGALLDTIVREFHKKNTEITPP